MVRALWLLMKWLRSFNVIFPSSERPFLSLPSRGRLLRVSRKCHSWELAQNLPHWTVSSSSTPPSCPHPPPRPKKKRLKIWCLAVECHLYYSNVWHICSTPSDKTKTPFIFSHIILCIYFTSFFIIIWKYSCIYTLRGIHLFNISHLHPPYTQQLEVLW